uniref:Transmembrane protein n=1 Tax=Pediastrum duplex TaxID=3105 RepID=A0A2U8GJ90_PEDDU|nr:hypothetical protein [Pediastrum duplex]
MRRLFAPSPRLFGSLALVSLQLRFSFAKEAKPCQPHKLLCIFGFGSSARLRQSRRSEEPSQHACTSSAKPKKEAFALVLLRLHKCSLLRSASSALRFFGALARPRNRKKRKEPMRRLRRRCEEVSALHKGAPKKQRQSLHFMSKVSASLAKPKREVAASVACRFFSFASFRGVK